MLDIDMEFKHGILVTRLKGILNGDTVLLFKNDLETVIKNNGIKYVLLNLKQLSYIDHFGLEAIESSYKQIVNNSGKLILCGMDRILKANQILTDNLYQVNEEVTAYEMINI